MSKVCWRVARSHEGQQGKRARATPRLCPDVFVNWNAVDGRHFLGSVTRGVLVLGCALMVLGCDNAKVKKCHAEMQTSQKALLDMDKTDIESVENALSLVNQTLAACEKADRAQEVADIRDAKRQVSAHLEALEERASQPERKKLSPEELAQLEAQGDPNCPKGQGYEHPQSDKVIRCTGKQLAQMPWTQAWEHFEKRGYKLDKRQSPPGFKAEFGARAYEFTYEEVDDESAPQCLVVTGKPRVAWQEIVARTTGVHPRRLEKDQPVPLPGRSLPLSLEGGPEQWTVGLGDCSTQSE